MISLKSSYTSSKYARLSWNLCQSKQFDLYLFAFPLANAGSRNKDLKLEVTQLVGPVWEACSSLKKTPATNITAIGRAMTQVAVSVKDVLRELKELKPASTSLTDEASDDGVPTAESGVQDDDNLSLDELGNDLSPEEMKVAQSAIRVVFETTVVIKELIRTITGMLKQEKPDDGGSFVDSLEKLLNLCRGISVHIDELGACLYPPQEVIAIKAALEGLSHIISEMLAVVESFKTSSATFSQACSGLRSSITQMESELENSCTTDIEAKMHNVTVSD